MRTATNLKAMSMISKSLLIAVALSVCSTTTVLHAAAHKPDTFWTYKRVGDKELKLSVFLPADYDSDQRFPVMVWFHGGSWNAGEANWHYPDCEYWSRRGMIGVSVDYRLRDRDGVQVPLACVKDAKAAIVFLRRNAAKLKVDPERIVAAGGSAGGQLAAATAMIRGRETYDDPDETISCIPNAIILTNPWFRCADSLSPPKHVRSGLPPVITFIGDQDPAIPVASLRDFDTSLRAAGVPSELHVGVGGKHGFCNGRNPRNPFFWWSLELSDRFLVKHGLLTGPSLINIPAGVRRIPLTAAASD
jgi:acetyl esterase